MPFMHKLTFRSGYALAAFGLVCTQALATAADAQSTSGGGYGLPSAPTARSTSARRPDCPSRTTYRNGRCQPDDTNSHHHDDGAAIGILGLLAIGGAIAASSSGHSGHHDDHDASEDLLRDGPQLPTSYELGTFWARGFGKDGWPIVLDFAPQPNTQTTLYVMFGKDKVWSAVIDSNGLDKRHLQLVTLPKTGWAASAKPATYYLRSMTLDYMGRPVAPAPIEVYGIGGGPRAVGSVAIEQLVFGPPTMKPGASASFDYFAKSPFDHTRTEVLRYSDDGKTIRLSQVMAENAPDVSVGTHGGAWDGRDQGTGQISRGVHRFQVRGWFTSGDQSWVGAVAPTQVTIR